jgi:hypothetical protein
MSKTSKQIWVVEAKEEGEWVCTAFVGITRREAEDERQHFLGWSDCDAKARVVKYIPAPVTPKAKPAPKVSVLTDWIPISTPPAHHGVYKLLGSPDSLPYSYWCGEQFHGAWESVEAADRFKHFHGLGCASDATHYRGFTTPQS